MMHLTKNRLIFSFFFFCSANVYVSESDMETIKISPAFLLLSLILFANTAVYCREFVFFSLLFVAFFCFLCLMWDTVSTCGVKWQMKQINVVYIRNGQSMLRNSTLICLPVVVVVCQKNLPCSFEITFHCRLIDCFTQPKTKKLSQCMRNVHKFIVCVSLVTLLLFDKNVNRLFCTTYLRNQLNKAIEIKAEQKKKERFLPCLQSLIAIFKMHFQYVKNGKQHYNWICFAVW